MFDDLERILVKSGLVYADIREQDAARCLDFACVRKIA
jgi:hypothetical protein